MTVPGDGGLVGRFVEDVRRTRRAVRGSGARILHLTAQYHTGTYREWMQWRIARAAGLRFVLDIRGGCFIEAYERNARPLERRLWRSVLRGADAITVEGRSDARWLEARFGRSATWFPNFVHAADRTRFAPAPLEPPRPGEPLRLVYAGQLRPEKGLSELVDACGLLGSRGTPVTLDLAGVGEERFVDSLRTRAAALPAGTLRLAGRLEHAALLGLLRTAHVFVFPSRWHCEGHSNAVNEAMQMGLPVVATRQGFSEDVVTPDCGRIVGDGAGPTLAAAIADLAGDFSALRRAGSAARERVYAEFGDDVVLARLEAVWRGLLGDPPPS